MKKIALISFMLMGCGNVGPPEETYYQFEAPTKFFAKNDTIYLSLSNPLKCPLRYYINSSDTTFDRHLSGFKPILLPPLQDTLLKIAGDSNLVKKINMQTILGDLHRKVTSNTISLPFPKGKNYEIIQGYNGTTHGIDDFARYAIDFNLKLNDTICAADDGVVVGVIKDYKDGGADERWRNYANFITIYHPHSGLFTQYVHMDYSGSFVIVGDTVTREQPIGLSGLTGWTDIEHLHFNAFIADSTKLGSHSVKIAFIEGYDGENMKRGNNVTK